MEFHPSRCHALVDAFRGLAAGHTKKSANNWWVSLVVVATDLNICFKNIIYIYNYVYLFLYRSTHARSIFCTTGWVGGRKRGTEKGNSHPHHPVSHSAE